MKQLFYNGVIVTGENQVVIPDGFMVVEDGVIEVVGTQDQLDQFSSIPNKVNLKGNWLIPGLINTHGHIGSTLLRGYGDDLPLATWLETKMWPMEAKFTDETINAAASLAILEMLKSGTTTFLEMYHLHLDLIANLVDTSGIRSCLTRGMIGLCSKTEQESKLAEALQLSRDLRKIGQGRITTMLAPHAPYTCPPEFLEMIVHEAKKQHLPIHTHLSETAKEVSEHFTKYGKRPVEHLAEIGVFDVHTLIAHGVHLTDEELDILEKYQVAVSHNPMSNLKLGSGIAPVGKMLKKQILVSIGTDSAASNNNLDMFQEMRMAALIHKGSSEDPTVVSANEAFLMATYNGAKALGFDSLGLVEVGYAADFVIVNAEKPHLQPNSHVLSHLVYSASGADVVEVYVNGKCLVRDGQCLTMDEEQIIFYANKAFKKLYS
ncbi:amidohydrolase [Anaerobacillus alkaliphilus]|uniref:5-methylthioadenosine/S-adenosylhomocysteine deaminase n=1 Tax=Anaerobacillus alkaliphilus TaxID=1548597 RepID=A0A4Q0VWH2_9BACI|nr:amidohydrolase [Anaerobacillus alkaliphilus]RXJ03984.1 amidohydrolase [Anaerobacillus alkaliphilus]